MIISDHEILTSKICSFFKFEFLSTNGVPEMFFEENYSLKTLSILYGDYAIFSHGLDEFF